MSLSILRQTITIGIYLEDLSTTWAGNNDHGGGIAVDDFSATQSGCKPKRA